MPSLTFRHPPIAKFAGDDILTSQKILLTSVLYGLGYMPDYVCYHWRKYMCASPRPETHQVRQRAAMEAAGLMPTCPHVCLHEYCVEDAVKQAVTIHLSHCTGDILIHMTGRDEMETTRVALQAGRVSWRVYTTICCKFKVHNPKMGLDSLAVDPLPRLGTGVPRQLGRSKPALGPRGPGTCYRLFTESAFRNERRAVGVEKGGQGKVGGSQSALTAIFVHDLLYSLISPSGRLVSSSRRRMATGSWDSTARVWEAAPGGGGGWRCAATLEGHTGGVLSVSWRPDGRRLATGSVDKTVKVWEAAPGGGGGWRCAATLEGHTNWVWSVAWSPDGRRLATCSDDKTARVWEAAPGGGRLAVCSHAGGHTVCLSVAWSPDGRRMATGSADNTVKVWEAAPGGGGGWRCVATLEGHTDDVASEEHIGHVRFVAWSPDGRRLATGSADKTARVWEAATEEGTAGAVWPRWRRTLAGRGGWRCAATLEGHTGWVFSVAWSPDGRRMATGSDKTARRLATGSADKTARRGGWRCVATLEGHTSRVYSVAWSPDGRRLATGSADKTARVWRPPAPVRRVAPPQPVARHAANLRHITPTQLDAALGGARQVLGSGGFGTVYRGTLDGAPVAIKLLDPEGLQGRKEYLAEAQTLARLRHRHLVNIYAACEERLAVVMELMEGGTLEERLREGNAAWNVRMRMLYEACVGLLFLHNSSPSAILHRDFKPSNILLSGSGMAKLADVGLAKAVPVGGTRISSHSTVVGSLGFIDPHYIQSAEYRAASDVYSVGVSILLALLGRTEPTGMVDEVKDAKDDGMEMDLLDRRPGAGQWDSAKAASVMRLALRCVHSNQSRRPSLADVVEQLAEFKDARAPAQSDARPAAGPTALDMEEWLICPITQDIMADPVLAEDGYTYEREAIAAHFRRRAVSPMTNLPIGTAVFPNRIVKSMVEEW
eukprot:jgi/Tetstr1/456066/TSEL_042836.t1